MAGAVASISKRHAFKSAPEPRIEPADRAIFSAAEPEPPMAMPEPPVAAPAAPALRATPEPGGLLRDDLRKLHAVLHELAECRKLIDGALARAG